MRKREGGRDTLRRRDRVRERDTKWERDGYWDGVERVKPKKAIGAKKKRRKKERKKLKISFSRNVENGANSFEKNTFFEKHFSAAAAANNFPDKIKMWWKFEKQLMFIVSSLLLLLLLQSGQAHCGSVFMYLPVGARRFETISQIVKLSFTQNLTGSSYEIFVLATWMMMNCRNQFCSLSIYASRSRQIKFHETCLTRFKSLLINLLDTKVDNL